jgi:hypothetical protein
MAAATAGPGPSSYNTKPITPHYCGVCSLPTEYCEFGPSISKCKTWLEGRDKDEYERLWGKGEWKSDFGSVSVSVSVSAFDPT